ncbi:DnaJ domain-containing protein [Dechloromonas sp. A34]|uniref:DnaJ domain-containing protein n=1 Tax=Dechloromonas sp. A34 TaxID=447588 RepID=UPI00224972DF|nr:DnaJ domain-containing protein [Dechloromonas sp. A34]
MPATVLNVAKSKPVTAKTVPSGVITVPAGNIMGVAGDVAQEEIRRAYRQLVGQYHPDVEQAPATDIGFKERGVMGDV